MTQDKVTLKEIMTAVREFTFDRFVIPAFAIKASDNPIRVQIDKTWNPNDGVIPPSNEENPEVLSEETVPVEQLNGRIRIVETKDSMDIESTFPFKDYPTMEELIEAISNQGFIVAYTPYFRGAEPSTALVPLRETLLEGNNSVTLFRRYFFSDVEIERIIRDYYRRVLDIFEVELSDTIIGRLVRPSEEHLALWVSYHIVEKRRLYEQAAGVIGQSFSDGTDYVGSDLSQATGTTTTTQIGSVFTITEDPSRGYFYEDFNRVGSENVLGDRYSFWYKLQLWLRQQIEERFGDYSLRKNNVIMGYTELTRELDFRSYYDSYPFTLSPLSRGILSKT